jgi:hypothetical protein
MNWTEDHLAEHLRRRSLAGSPPCIDTSIPPFLPPANEAGAFARGRMPDEGMNKTEAAYAQHLEMRKRAGEVLWYRFEPLKLRLADGSYFKPDFGVLTRDCLFELHETKGFWREAARVRIKIAAALFPFKFIAIKRTQGGWEREEFS